MRGGPMGGGLMGSGPMGAGLMSMGGPMSMGGHYGAPSPGYAPSGGSGTPDVAVMSQMYSMMMAMLPAVSQYVQAAGTAPPAAMGLAAPGARDYMAERNQGAAASAYAAAAPRRPPLPPQEAMVPGDYGYGKPAAVRPDEVRMAHSFEPCCTAPQLFMA